MVEYRLSLFLPIGQALKILWHLDILTLESMGKPKMWNILKRLIVEQNGQIWDSGSCSPYMEGTFDAQFPEFGLGSFGAVLKSLLLSQFSSDSSKFYTLNHNHTDKFIWSNQPLYKHRITLVRLATLSDILVWSATTLMIHCK